MFSVHFPFYSWEEEKQANRNKVTAMSYIAIYRFAIIGFTRQTQIVIVLVDIEMYCNTFNSLQCIIVKRKRERSNVAVTILI